MKLLFTVFLYFYLSLSLFSQSIYEVVVLGSSQDGGYPQLGCSESCCQSVWVGDNERHYVASIAIVELTKGEIWLVDCTPDIALQMQLLRDYFGGKDLSLKGIFLTHAHIGHYLGLAQFGKEVTGDRGIKIYAMPRMKSFLESNGPWKQLVELRNIEIQPLQAGLSVAFGDLSITPIIVPHRDEYSETVAYEVKASGSQLLYLPDIDSWTKWDKNIQDYARTFDFLLLDGTFFDASGFGGRSAAEVPHPIVTETMTMLAQSPAEVRKKVYFTHLNHSNPLHFTNSEQYSSVTSIGFNVARQGMVLKLFPK